MRKLLLGSICAIVLASCATTAPTSTGSAPSDKVNAVISAVQQNCGVVVTGIQIAGALTGNATVNSVSGWADAICNAFKARAAKRAASARGDITVVVNGARITGHFAR